MLIELLGTEEIVMPTASAKSYISRISKGIGIGSRPRPADTGYGWTTDDGGTFLGLNSPIKKPICSCPPGTASGTLLQNVYQDQCKRGKKGGQT